MWFILGILAIVATFMNLFKYKTGQDYKFFMAMGLSFTALSVVTMFSDMSSSVIKEDWTSLMDVMPTMASFLWILTVISIGLNITPIVLENRKSQSE